MIIKSSKPSVPVLLNKINGTAYFKQKGYCDNICIDIGSINNCPKSNITTLTAFYVINLRQTQKDVEKDVRNYADMKILAQFDRIENSSEKEMEEAQNKDPNRNFLYCTFPVYEGEKLHDVNEHIWMITVLGDLGAVFFDNGFSIND